MFLLYNLALLLLSPLLFLFLVVRLAGGKSRQGWAQRWGAVRDAVPAKQGRRVWIHAASVGEMMAATPVLKGYKAVRPDDEIVVSVITPGGHEVASGLMGSVVTAVVYAPFDVPIAVNRAVAAIQPDLFVCLETELWPNLLHAVRRSGARMALLNGRISDRSFGRYFRARAITAWALGQFDRVWAQSELDAQRLQQLGAPQARTETFGNVKFDQTQHRLDAAEVAALRGALKLADGAPVFIIGSTRQPDEERLLLDAYLSVRRELPGLALIHAPRHVERAGEAEQLMREKGLSPVRKTAIADAAAPVEQLILDTYGELANTYAAADVAFIGNSLTPPGGGQNLLQPLAQGKPVLYGPYMQNFRDAVALAERHSVGFRVESARELATRIVDLIRNEATREELGRKAVGLVEANRGVAARYVSALVELMDDNTRTA